MPVAECMGAKAGVQQAEKMLGHRLLLKQSPEKAPAAPLNVVALCSAHGVQGGSGVTHGYGSSVSIFSSRSRS